MKLTLIFILVTIFTKIDGREVYYEDVNYYPKESNQIIDYDSLKLTRSKDKTLIYFRGNFSILTDIGNDKLIMLELHNANGAMMARSVKPFCEFVKGETIFWPSLVKSSNMPRDNPCPFPSGDYMLQKFSVAFSKSLVQPLPNGVYTMTIMMQQDGKDVLKYVIKFALRK